MLGSLLAAIVNPSAELLAAQEEWFARHPVLGGALVLFAFCGLVPLCAALGWLS